MEYEEETDGIEFDQNKFKFINAIGQKWADTPCEELSNPDRIQKCVIFRELSQAYGKGVTSLQKKLNSCYAMNDENVAHLFKQGSFEQCMISAERENTEFIEYFYELYFKVENLS